MLSASETMQQILKQKEQLLAGWIVYCAMSNSCQYGCSPEHMKTLFGAWLYRTPQIVQRDSSYFLEC